MAKRNKKGQFVKGSSRERRTHRDRRSRTSRRGRIMARVRGAKKRVSVLKIVGFGLGTYFGMTPGQANDPMVIAQNPVGAIGNLFTAMTGYSLESHSWALQNMETFWVPVITFVGLDWLGKKIFHHNVKLSKDVSLF